MVLATIHERGAVFYHRGEHYAIDMPGGWMSPTEFSGREALRGAIRRASAKLGFPLRGPYRLMVFTEFFQYFSEIKAHMRPSPEEVRALVWERFKSFYGVEGEGEVLVGYAFGIDGLYATALAKEAAEGLASSFPGPVHLYSGTLSFVRGLQAGYPSRPKLMAFFIEMGTALGASFLQGEIYAISRLPVLERVNPSASLPQELVADYVAQVDEEVQTLLPPGMGNLHLVVTGAWGEAVLKQLSFSAPYEFAPVPQVWDLSQAQDALYYTHPGAGGRRELKKLLLPGAVGLVLGGIFLYGFFLGQRVEALKEEIARNQELIQQGRAMERELKAAEASLSRYRQALEYLSLSRGPEEALRPVLRAYGSLDPRFRLKELSLLQGGEASLRVVLSKGPYPDAPGELRRAFRQAGYERVEILRLEYSGDREAETSFELNVFPKRETGGAP